MDFHGGIVGVAAGVDVLIENCNNGANIIGTHEIGGIIGEGGSDIFYY